MTATDTLTERARARIGSVLRGKWHLERVLGVGGMASVYAAVHKNNGARAAIKLLHPEIALNREVTERFLREGYAANLVDHRGTVKVLDDDVSEDGAPFLVMELLEGETIEARWERKDRRLALSEVLAIADQLLDVLAVAHDKGIVHRDLKPDNLFLTRSGDLKILDFGIARLRELPPENATRTRVGTLLGTPAYMAPEQARGRWELVDARTDIWSVGATMFTLLTGRFVHDAKTVQELLITTATSCPRSLGVLLPDLPQGVIGLVDCALSFDPAQRWPDARTMQSALRASLELEREVDAPLTLPTPSVPRNEMATPPPAARTVPPTWVSSPRGRATMMLIAGMSISVGAGLAAVWELWPKAPREATAPVEHAAPPAGSNATIGSVEPPAEPPPSTSAPPTAPSASASAVAGASAPAKPAHQVPKTTAGSKAHPATPSPATKPPVVDARPEHRDPGGKSTDPFDRRF